MDEIREEKDNIKIQFDETQIILDDLSIKYKELLIEYDLQKSLNNDLNLCETSNLELINNLKNKIDQMSELKIK